MMSNLVEWGFASRPLVVDGESGDALWVRVGPTSAIIAVVDGVGHGPAAAVAARRAVELIAAGEGEDPVRAMQRCHEGLRETRGVALSVAWFDAEQGRMSWMGVGSVQGMLLRANPRAVSPRESLMLRGGVLGRQLPVLHASVVAVAPGDRLVFATDGVRSTFAPEWNADEPTQTLADRILNEHGTGADDALVVAVRYRGTAS